MFNTSAEFKFHRCSYLCCVLFSGHITGAVINVVVDLQQGSLIPPVVDLIVPPRVEEDGR